ncbi:hypothetical protein ZIOFF_001691 [Zingiber officinale]|uniref:Auxin-responsive protein n=1 Tax=Zingiber officinale TaxID=94328 RepID=A0A8J5IN66_ZINOF|nr:hypothetical protein ZIOFF_001691 [Zingiber officinale]
MPSEAATLGCPSPSLTGGRLGKPASVTWVQVIPSKGLAVRWTHSKPKFAGGELGSEAGVAGMQHMPSNKGGQMGLSVVRVDGLARVAKRTNRRELFVVPKRSSCGPSTWCENRLWRRAKEAESWITRTDGLVHGADRWTARGAMRQLLGSVHKQGVALGRSVDLIKFDGYDQLIEELDQLFEFKGELMAPNKNWMIVFTDNEDDMMLVGDDPWQEFCAMVRQIFIYTKEEVQKMDSSTLNPKNEDCPDMKENVKETKGSLVKILKKYDKRTGALIRQPFIEKVLQQPFFTTDLLYKLVKESVAMLDHLFPNNNLSISAEYDGQNGVPKSAQSSGRVPELEEIKYMQSLYMKSTVAALRSLKQIRSKSSTVKTD